MPGANTPATPFSAIIQARRLVIRQGTVKEIVKLAVTEDRQVQFRDVVHLLAKPDTDFRQNALNKFKIGFPPLSDQFTNRVLAGQRKFKVRAFHAMCTQQLFHDFRHGDILVKGTAA
jgi:hypothetical protein